MENISIEPTKKSLEVECSPGYFKLSGNSILSDPRKFFQPIVEWVEEYIKDPKDKTTVDLKLEYVDTASVQSVFDIRHTFKGMCPLSNTGTLIGELSAAHALPAGGPNQLDRSNSKDNYFFEVQEEEKGQIRTTDCGVLL